MNSETPKPRDGPLAGIKVVDLTRVLAGPYCTMVLADLGARVIKIEPPGIGDDARQFGPFVQGRPCYFGSINRDKESIALDLRTPRDREIFEALLLDADVVAENFRPGVMEKLGYGWEYLHERYPQLIYCATSGFGHTGPSKEQPGYDMVMQAMSGLMSVTGERGGDPCRVGISIGDLSAGLFSTIGVSSALFHRERTGKGIKIDIGMFDCLTALMESVIMRYWMTGEIGGRMGSAHPAIMPFEAMRTADGYIVVACGNSKLFETFCKAIGRLDLAQDERFATNVDRVKHRESLREEIESVLACKPTEEWAELLLGAGVPSGPILNVDQALQHPQVTARNMIVEATDRVLGKVKLVGTPLKFSAFVDSAVRRAAPDLDQDRDRILQELAVRGPDVATKH